MLFSVEQAFVGREEIRAPLKRPAGEASLLLDGSRKKQTQNLSAMGDYLRLTAPLFM